MIEGSSDSKISHENLFQIRNLIENLAPAEPKNFIKREKSSRKFYRKLQIPPRILPKIYQGSSIVQLNIQRNKILCNISSIRTGILINCFSLYIEIASSVIS